MELRQKIEQVRHQKKMSREDLYNRLKEIFGNNAIKPNTIWRIESGLTSARMSSLHQICVGLGVSLKELLEDVEQKPKLVDIIKKKQRLEQFVYNEKARAEILSPPNLIFLTQELTLLPAGATKLEQDPIELEKFQKWIYCLSGVVECIIGTERHILNKGDCLSFESNIPHHLENNSSRRARCLIVQHPRHI